MTGKCLYLCRTDKWYCGYGILDGKKYLPLANVKITDIPVNPTKCRPENCDYFSEQG